MKKYRKINNEVFYTVGDFAVVGVEDLAFLKEQAIRNARKRCRLCTHAGPEDMIHEMFIVFHRDAYVRPHKHIGKAESLEVLEGAVDIVFYDNDGKIVREVGLGTRESGADFYCHVAGNFFHTLRIRSEFISFKEVACGPFRREDTAFADWSPEDKDTEGVSEFIRILRQKGSTG